MCLFLSPAELLFATCMHDKLWYYIGRNAATIQCCKKMWTCCRSRHHNHVWKWKKESSCIRTGFYDSWSGLKLFIANLRAFYGQDFMVLAETFHCKFASVCLFLFAGLFWLLLAPWCALHTHQKCGKKLAWKMLWRWPTASAWSLWTRLEPSACSCISSSCWKCSTLLVLAHVNQLCLKLCTRIFLFCSRPHPCMP